LGLDSQVLKETFLDGGLTWTFPLYVSIPFYQAFFFGILYPNNRKSDLFGPFGCFEGN
jgi:hypothetical protein